MAVKAVDPNPAWTPDQAGGHRFHGFAITPSDTDELTTVINAIYVGVSGDVTVVMVDDVLASAVTLKSVPVGLLTGLRIRQIKATGTAATNMVGFY